MKVVITYYESDFGDPWEEVSVYVFEKGTDTRPLEEKAVSKGYQHITIDTEDEYFSFDSVSDAMESFDSAGR